MESSQRTRTRFTFRGVPRLAYDPGQPERSRPDTLPVLALHDLLADRASVVRWLAAQAEQRRLIAPDARGHGASASLANQWYSVAELAADALAILDAEEIATCHVIGHGLGGATAVELARRSPERVRSLILLEPAIYAVLDTDPDPAVRAAQQDLRTADRSAGDFAYKGQTDKALDAYLAPRWGSDWRARVARPRLAALYRHAGALAALLPALDAYSLDPADAAGITVPTLILVGEGDAVPQLASARLATVIPHARITRLPGRLSLDGISEETEAAIGAALENFLSALDSEA